MNWDIDKEKKAIRDHSVFTGLEVDDREKFARLFLHPNFKLALIYEPSGYVIFEEFQGKFVFHLVNFNETTASNITDKVLRMLVAPYCLENGLSHIQARAERRGMERKLERRGMMRRGNVFIGETQNVF